MKRSEINNYITEAITFLKAQNWALPPFAFLSLQNWQEIMKNEKNRKMYQEIIEKGLGWDITDFGSTNFEQTGLLLFTMRNGSIGNSRDYAEKIMISKENQITPWHFHWAKTEDIINRGGGHLVIEVYNASNNDIMKPNETWTPGIYDNKTPVRLIQDGILKEFSPGQKIILTPGESVALPPRVYHSFYGLQGKGMVMVGEISNVNDDKSDNRFYQQLPRFTKIIEDEPSKYVLCNEYLQLT